MPQETNKDTLRAELMEIDVLYAKYQEAKHGYPFKGYKAELAAFEGFRDSLVAKYGKDLIALRNEALTDSERAYVQDLLGHAVNLK